MPSIDKVMLRAALRSLRKALSPEERNVLSVEAQRHLLQAPAWKQAVTVGLYTATAEETDTSLLLESAWSEGKNVLLPLCSPDEKGHMEFCPCTGWNHLRPGAFGILEPEKDSAHTEHSLPEVDLVIVPGVAFDREGRRLGMGAGYYDRFFAAPEKTSILRIGLAFSFQVVDSLPGEKWDLPVHAICTEKGLICIENT